MHPSVLAAYAALTAMDNRYPIDFGARRQLQASEPLMRHIRLWAHPGQKPKAIRRRRRQNKTAAASRRRNR